MKSLDDITGMQLAVFREIATIGAGNAATALAKLLNMRMNMAVPDVRIVPFNEVADLLNGAENIIAGVMVAMSGDLKGYIMLVQEMRDACELLSVLLGETKDPSMIESDEMCQSALTEISNILIGAYLSAISGMTHLRINASVPELVIDMAGAILSVPAIEYGEIGDGVLFLETQFSNADRQIGGQFFLIPDLNSYSVLMKSLGVEDE
jgi:chemotaxis protein CheC